MRRKPLDYKVICNASTARGMAKEYNIVIRKDGKFYVGYCQEMRQARGQGDTIPEAVEDTIKAIKIGRSYFQYREMPPSEIRKAAAGRRRWRYDPRGGPPGEACQLLSGNNPQGPQQLLASQDRAGDGTRSCAGPAALTQVSAGEMVSVLV